MCCSRPSTAPAPPAERLIGSLDEVRALAGDLRSLRVRRQKVVVRVPELDAEERHRLEAEIARYASACGCGQGRAAGVVTLLAFVVSILAGALPWRELGVGKVALLYLGVSLLTMLTGKLYGLLRARLALARLCRELVDRRLPSAEGLPHGSRL